MLDVVDEININSDLARVYTCFWAAPLWPAITSHVKRIEMLEWRGEHQRFLMTVSANGKDHVVESVREAVPNEQITYRQLTPPAFFRSHQGMWRFASGERGVSVSVRHTVDIDFDKARALFGLHTDHSIEELVSVTLHANGMTTMVAVKNLLE
jgi:Polyketide cyclase / dehydrase and lipid transport